MGYVVQVFLAVEDGLFGLVGGPEELAAGELRQDEVEFEFVDQLLEFLMEILELAVAQFGDLGPPRLLISHLQHVDDLATALRLVVDDLGLQVHHHQLYYAIDWRAGG